MGIASSALRELRDSTLNEIKDFIETSALKKLSDSALKEIRDFIESQKELDDFLEHYRLVIFAMKCELAQDRFQEEMKIFGDPVERMMKKIQNQQSLLFFTNSINNREFNILSSIVHDLKTLHYTEALQSLSKKTKLLMNHQLVDKIKLDDDHPLFVAATQIDNLQLFTSVLNEFAPHMQVKNFNQCTLYQLISICSSLDKLKELNNAISKKLTDNERPLTDHSELNAAFESRQNQLKAQSSQVSKLTAELETTQVIGKLTRSQSF